MDIKISVAGLVLPMVFTTYCLAADIAKDAPQVNYAPMAYLKNYALSSCLYHGYQAKDLKQDALIASQAYKESGSLSIDAYNAAHGLVEQYLAKTYLSEGGEKLTVMKCIDLFHSKELDQLAKKYNKERNAGLKTAKPR